MIVHILKFQMYCAEVQVPSCGPESNSSQGDAVGFLLLTLAGPVDAPGEDPFTCRGDPGPAACLPFLLWIFQGTDKGRVSRKL